MKKILTAGFSFFFAFFAFAEQKIVNSDLKEVTVYPIGAMISREAKVNIGLGNTIVVFDNLTPAIDPNTIQVGGIGDFEILSVKFEHFYPYAKAKPKGIEAIEDSISMYRDKRYLLEDEDNNLDEERQLILANKKLTNDKGAVSVEQLNAMANYYRDRLNAISKEKLRIQNERNWIISEEQRLNSTLSGMNNYKNEQVGRILVEVNSKKALMGLFKFSFFTHLAGWTPKYNVKAKSDFDKIEVDFHANVTQSTGVDWKNIDLILSTSRPTFNNQKPELHPWYLDFYNARSKGYYGGAASQGTYEPMVLEEVQIRKDANAYYEDGQYKEMDKKESSYLWATQLINALNTSYIIDSKYTVMSNNASKQVFIKNIMIPAVFNHYAVPSMEKEAFLTASIADWGSYDLIPGSATLFYNNTYVGNSYIATNTTDDTLQISLGRDQGIMISHEKVTDLCTHKKIGGNIRKNYVYEISVKNTNSQEITIVIMDRVPVSKRNEIVVTNGNLAGADYDEKTGILKWTKTIAPGAKETIQFDYEVKYPKDVRINL